MKKYALPLVLSLSGPAWGQPSSGTLSWAEVAAAVEAANPELAMARAKAQAVGARVAQAWTPDAPTVEFERMLGPVQRSPLDGDERSWVVRQQFAAPPVLYWRKQTASRAARAEEQRVLAKRNELSARARQTFALLRLSWVEREVLDEGITILRRAARVAEAKVAGGKASQTDALKAQTELSRMLGLREAVERSVTATEAELSALMGRRPGPLARPAPAQTQPPPALAALEGAAAGRPELRAAVLDGDRAAATAAAARAEWLPMLMAGYRRRSAPMTGRTHDALLGLSVPLWYWRPAAMVKEADAERRMAVSEAEAVRLDTAAMVRASHERLLAALRLAEVYRTAVLPQAEAALATAEKAYASDRGGFLDFLDAQRTLIDLTLERERALADAEARRAELARAVGKEL
ncbi:MAG: TolC family protein [Elusimicrobia bacterium]|nr:TolC family protein [Elusimicrobiota bacterium]